MGSLNTLTLPILPGITCLILLKFVSIYFPSLSVVLTFCNLVFEIPSFSAKSVNDVLNPSFFGAVKYDSKLPFRFILSFGFNL